MAGVGKKIYMEQLSNSGKELQGGLGLRKMVVWIANRYPGLGLLAMVLMFLASLAEGIGLVTVIPLLGIVLSSGADAATGFNAYVYEAFALLELELNANTLVTMLLLAVLFKAIMRYFGIKVVGYFSADIAKWIRQDVLSKITRVEWSYFVANKTGEVAAALTHAVDKTSNTGVQIAKFVSMFFQVAIVLALSAVVSLEITLLALISGVLTFFLLGGFVRIARVAGAEQTDIMNRFTSRLLDSIGAIKPIKAMGCEDRILPLLHNDVDQLNKSQKKLVHSSVMLEIAPEPITAFTIGVAMLFIMNSEVLTTQPEVMLGLMVLFARVIMSLHTMQSIYKSLAVGQAAFWFINNMGAKLEAKQELMSDGIEHQINQSIKFMDLDFGYDGKTILEKANTDIPAGKIVTITGRSGTGKTTVIDLIIGLMGACKGQILVDGINIEDLDKGAWRKQIGYVPQDTFLFNDSIYNNVTLRDESISREAVAQALEESKAMDFVQDLEYGLDTMVGERGMMFSGGQRQRLSIARALVRNPRLLILDEATSSLDPDSERAICETLVCLSQKKPDLTILAVSHHPALVQIADIVYVIHDGNLVTVDCSDRDDLEFSVTH